jgi:predicted dehydrogenase
MNTRSWNRRQFLAATTISAAAISTEASLLGADGQPQKPPISIGFLGAMHSHAMDKLDVVRASTDYNLVGVHEEDATAIKACETRGVPIISRDTLLEKCQVVVVESAVRDHARHARMVLESGKQVHVEKPPAANLSEMQALVSLAQQKKLLLQVGYMWRYHPGFAAIFEAKRNGWLGEIFLVRASINNSLAPERRRQWAEFKGGSMFELGSHLIDATVRLLGKPQSVTPMLHHHGSATDDLKDNNLAVLNYDHAVAVITNSALQQGSIPARSFEVLGSNGSAVLSSIEPPVLEIDLINPAGPFRKGVQTVSLARYKRFVTDFAELAAAVRGERPLTITLEEELAVQEALLKASDML